MTPAACIGIRVITDILLVFVIGVPLIVLHYGVQPFQRGFYCNDESLMHPLLRDTVTNAMLIGVGIGVPIFVILVIELIYAHHADMKKESSVYPPLPQIVVKLYTWMATFLFGIIVVQLLTDIGKFSVGRLRPHFFAACMPNMTLVNCSVYNTANVCTNPNKSVLKNARVSFPSGHASFSMYCAVFLIIYVQHRLKLHPISLLRPVAQVAAFAVAFYVGLSRISDYKHHWSDVLTGSLLGLAVAIVVWYYLLRGLTARKSMCDSKRPQYSEPDETVSMEQHQPTAVRIN